MNVLYVLYVVFLKIAAKYQQHENSVGALYTFCDLQYIERNVILWGSKLVQKVDCNKL